MRNQKGFTLIELLVVIAIIGLLATLAVVSLNNARQKARDAKVKSDLNAIATSLELLNAEDGNYPSTAANCTGSATTVYTSGSGSPANAICSGNRVETSGGQVLLQSIPAHPVSGTNYTAYGSSSSYCLSSALETQSGTYFKCVNGSCFEASSACSSTSG